MQCEAKRADDHGTRQLCLRACVTDDSTSCMWVGESDEGDGRGQEMGARSGDTGGRPGSSDKTKTRPTKQGAVGCRQNKACTAWSGLKQIGADWSRLEQILAPPSRTCAREPQQNATSVLLRMRDLTLRHASSTFDARSVSSSSAVRSKADPLVWWRFRVTAVLPPPCCCHTPAATVDAYLFF